MEDDNVEEEKWNRDVERGTGGLTYALLAGP
jgi:hypothetical protein